MNIYTTIWQHFVPDYPVGPVLEETFIHSHPSWLSVVLYQLPLSTTIHSILLVQFSCLMVLFHNLCPGPLWSFSWSWTLYFILCTFLHPVIIFDSFRNTCPYRRSLFCCSIDVMSSILYLSAPYLEICLLPCNTTHPPDHSHHCSLKCHFILFPYRPGLTSMKHTVLHTTAVQPTSRIPLIGKQWYQLSELIPASSNSGLHICISISNHTDQLIDSTAENGIKSAQYNEIIQFSRSYWFL